MIPFTTHHPIMQELNRIQTLVYQLGGLILIAGAAWPLFAPGSRAIPYVYTVGALMFCSMQMLCRYDGNNIVARRLRRQQLLGALALLATAPLLFMSAYQTGPFPGAEWQMTLAVGAVLEAYTAFRLPAVLKGE